MAQTRDLATATGVGGRIVASNERWTSFVPIEQDGINELAAAVPGLALSWLYAEDFGLGMTFFEATDILGELRFVWALAHNQELATSVDLGLTNVLDSMGILDGIDQLLKLTAAIAAQKRRPHEIRNAAAAMLGLPAYQWLSPRYCCDVSIEELRSRFPHVEDVAIA